MYQLSILPGGLQVATVSMPWMQSVSLGVFLGVGSRHESAELSGISHFLEHMLFKGTEKRNVRDIAMEVEGNGGTLNAYTGETYTCYEARGPGNLLPIMSDVLSDMVLHPGFPPDELERERDVVLEEITMYKENPSDYVHELAARSLWGDHPLGRPIAGTEQTLQGMDADILRKFHREHYRTPAHLFVAAGAVSHEEMTDLAGRLYDGVVMDRPLPSSPVYNSDLYPSPGLLKESRDMEQTHFVLGFTTPGNDSRLRHALRLLSVLFGESMSSRLFQEIREKRGLAYSIYSDLSLYGDCGAFSIYAGVDSDNTEQALETIRKELDKIVEEPCSREELEQAKRYLLGQMTLMMDSSAGQMSWVGESLLQHGRIVQPQEIREKIEAVSPEDISLAARLILKGRTPALAIVGK